MKQFERDHDVPECVALGTILQKSVFDHNF